MAIGTMDAVRFARLQLAVLGLAQAFDMCRDFDDIISEMAADGNDEDGNLRSLAPLLRKLNEVLHDAEQQMRTEEEDAIKRN